MIEEDVGDEIKKTRKELKEKIDNDCGETKRKVELETNEIRYVFSGMFLSNININSFRVYIKLLFENVGPNKYSILPAMIGHFVSLLPV